MSKCAVELFSRVTGFFRPISTWNEGKQAEFKDRARFNTHTMEDTNGEEVNSNITEVKQV